MKRIFTLLMLAGLINPVWIQAQEVIASGGSATMDSGSGLTWTIGEAVVGEITTGSYLLNQGFQMGWLTSNAIENHALPEPDLSVYPNPFTYILNLKADENSFPDLRYSLLTLDGRVLIQAELTESTTALRLGALPAGCYILQVIDKTSHYSKSYKILKQ